MIPLRHALASFFFAALLVLGGCRSYGGFDTKPETYEAMQAAVQSFADDLKRAQSDLRRLEEAAAQADTLQSLADRFADLVAKHESLLEHQRHRIDALSPEASYRTLHEAYGTMISEKRRLDGQYQRTIRNVYAAVQGEAVVRSSSAKGAQYMIEPVGFPRSSSGQSLTMAQALQGL